MVLPGSLSGATILQVIPDLAAGGAERTTVEVAEALVRAGATALVASAGGRLEGELAEAGGQLIRNESLRSKNPLVIRRNASWLAKLIRDKRVDLVHARSRAPAWSAYWASKQTRTHFVTTYHGAYNAKAALKRWYNSVMARGEVVIANSDYIADHVATIYPGTAARIIAIPRGVDLDAMRAEAISDERIEALRQAWFPGAAPPGPLFFLPGRLTRWKGQEDAIAAMALRRDIGADPLGTLILAGDDQGRIDYLEALKAQITAEKLDEAVKIVGHCADMPAAYHLCDIVLAPSREPEAFGRVAAEAGAMGRPAIAAAHGGQTEIIEDKITGRLVPPKDPRALAEAMNELARMSQTERDAMAIAATKRIGARFSKTALQTATLEVYSKLLERAG